MRWVLRQMSLSSKFQLLKLHVNDEVSLIPNIFPSVMEITEYSGIVKKDAFNSLKYLSDIEIIKGTGQVKKDAFNILY